MFKRILVAIDGSPTSDQGFKVALGLAKDQVAELYALHIVDEMAVTRGLSGAYGLAGYSDTIINSLREAGRKILAKAAAAAAKSDQNVETVIVETLWQGVAHTILAQARKLRADLIVLGTHGRRGISRLVMGSDAEAVLREARIPVLLVHSPATPHASRHATPPARGHRRQGGTHKTSVERGARLHPDNARTPPNAR